MPTVINNPPSGNSNNGMGFFLGVLLILVVGYLLLVYGLPILRQSATSTTPQINVPNQIDVNLKQSK